jgi:hypothetical protein
MSPGSIVDDWERALLEVADDRALEATAHAFVTRYPCARRRP